MKAALLVFLLFANFCSPAQTGLFTDPRDGQVYKTIVINGKTWFRENLRYQTQKSFCPNFNKDSSDCRDGNYYSNSELATVCPEGWHVSTIPEWEDYIRLLLKTNNINNGIIKYDSSLREPNSGYALQLDSSILWNDTLLRLVGAGWVEGWKLERNHGCSLWVIDTQGNDPKYHLHIGVKGYVKHTHDHHIFDKPRKVRKFPVRCVCERGAAGS